MVGQNFRVRSIAPDLGDGDGHNPHQEMEIAVCKWVGVKLEQWYPGHPWAVECEQGIVRIQLRILCPPDWWYVLKLSAINSDPGGKTTVLRAAGEILERYGFARRGFDNSDWAAALNKIPIKGRGYVDPLR
jgi:hypothetical protein